MFNLLSPSFHFIISNCVVAQWYKPSVNPCLVASTVLILVMYSNPCLVASTVLILVVYSNHSKCCQLNCFRVYLDTGGLAPSYWDLLLKSNYTIYDVMYVIVKIFILIMFLQKYTIWTELNWIKHLSSYKKTVFSTLLVRLRFHEYGCEWTFTLFFNIRFKITCSLFKDDLKICQVCQSLFSLWFLQWCKIAWGPEFVEFAVYRSRFAGGQAGSSVQNSLTEYFL